MFEGGSYGVGVTVNPLAPMPWDDVPPPAGVEVHPTRPGELMPVAARTQAERAADLERVCFVEGQLAAYKAEIIAAMARDLLGPGRPLLTYPVHHHRRTPGPGRGPAARRHRVLPRTSWP